MTADEIITAARAVIGVPFRHQGRSLSGLDCAGLIVHVARSFGLECIDGEAYSRHPSGGMLEATLDSQPCLVRVSEKQPGDVLLMRFAKDPQHLGIFTGDTLIHSYEKVGKVCEHRIDEAWARRIVRVYRFKEMA